MGGVNATGDRDPLEQTVARFGRRRRGSRRDRSRPLAVALSVMGTGWMIALPAVAGFLLGRHLDQRLHTGITLSAAIGLAGVCLGSWGAWRWLWRARSQSPNG